VVNRDSEVHCPLCQGEVKKPMSTFSYAVHDNIPGPASMDVQRKLCTTCS
jgi:hypothetical protein